MNDFTEIYRMTLYEYDMRMQAMRLRQVDREYDLHLLAWESWNVQAMKPQGKNKRVPVFKTFKQFFDYDKRLKEISGTKQGNNKKSRIAMAMKRQKERRQNDGQL